MLNGIPMADLGPAFLAGLAVLLVLVGRLVPRKSVDDALAQADKWERAHEVSEQARSVQAQQIDKLLESAETQTRLLESLREAANRRTP